MGYGQAWYTSGLSCVARIAITKDEGQGALSGVQTEPRSGRYRVNRRTIGTLDRFYPTECANFFNATGYQRST